MLELQAALLTPDSAIATHSIWIEKPTKHICTTSHMATTVFDVICLATGDTKHLYHAYFGCTCIQFNTYIMLFGTLVYCNMDYQHQRS